MYAGDFIISDIEPTLNDYKIHLIMSCETLHYRYDVPVDVVLSVL